ncbi:MAG TPA: hypothetical protein PK762_07955 [Candidatus Kapabacteria bacterium]|nr:hypothetical protein [Candidatus Kapabacteria bacterium]HPO62999.1 hypothetical protein [Candidatus Kapabacteria bacterium]
MIKNYKKYKEFEDEFVENNATTLKQRFIMFEEMYELCKKLNKYESYSLKSIENILKVKKVFNAVDRINKENLIRPCSS